MAKIRIDRTISKDYEEVILEIEDVDFDRYTINNFVEKSLDVKTLVLNTPIVTSKSDDTDKGMRYNIRRVKKESFLLDEIIAAKKEGKLDKFVSPFDEIDIPLDTGGYVTVVCAYSCSNWARFVFKNCWDEGVMNDEATNKGGYYKSKGRLHVLEDIWPHISPEWQAIIKPRKIVEEIDGERIEYADPMWLLSATDVFGPSEEGYWKDIDDSFQLPIFKRERDRVKECGSEGTYPYWLRSVDATNGINFCNVDADGGAYYYNAVLWAYEQGIVGGVGNRQFSLYGTLTYDQILAMLCRAAGWSAAGGD